MTEGIIQLVPASEYDREHYGIVLESAHVYRITGPGVYNGSSPHRLQVWANNRNPDASGLNQYLDPHGKPTSEEFAYLFAAESSVVSAHGDSTGTPESGQVYGEELRTMTFVRLRGIDNALSWYFAILPQRFANPKLVSAEKFGF